MDCRLIKRINNTNKLNPHVLHCTFGLYKLSGKMMKQIAVSEFRANMMKILKKIEHGASIDITSRGHVVAKLVPPDFSRSLAREELAQIAKKAIIGDVISPIDTDWKASQ